MIKVLSKTVIFLLAILIFIELQVFLFLVLWIEYRQWEYIKKLVFYGD